MAVPRNIAHLVEQPDRALFFRVRRLPPDNSGVALVLGGMGAVIGLFVAFCTGSVLLLLAALVSAAGGAALKVLIQALNKPVPEGSVDAGSFSWAGTEVEWSEVSGLRLDATPNSGAMLTTDQGHRLVRWPSVAASSDSDWDLASVRWFCGQVASLAQLPLVEDLGDESVWSARREDQEAGRQQLARLLELEPVGPEVIIGEDVIRIGLSGAFATVTREELTFMGRSELLATITGVDVHLFEGQRSDTAQLRVHLIQEPPWILHDERATQDSVTRLLGMRDALNDYLARVRPGNTDRGTAADVPQALRALRKE